MEGDEANGSCGTRFNVIAAFTPEQDSVAVLDRLARSGVRRSAVTVHRPGDEPDCEAVLEIEAEMGDETGASWAVLSGAQAKGAFLAALAIGLAGVALGLVGGLAWAYLFTSELSRLGRVALVACVTGAGGATVGLVVGGAGLARQQGGNTDRDDRPEAAERDLLVTVHLGDPGAAEQAAGVLRSLGAERVHFLDGNGVPLPPQAQHPRPADPEGYWWRHAGEG
jgi:hypothetical protein